MYGHDNCMNTEHMASALGKKESSSFLEACNWSSSRKNFSDDAPSNSSSCIDGQCVSSETSNILTGCSRNESKPTIFNRNRDSSNQCEKHDLLASSVDDLSCIARSDDVNMVVDNSGVNNERKDASSNSSVNDVLFTEQTADNQLNEHCQISQHSETQQSHKNIRDSPSLAASPNQSDPPEISLLRKFSTKGEGSICSEEKEGSSFNKMMTDREVAAPAVHSVSNEHKEKSYPVHDGPSRDKHSLAACAAGEGNVSDASYDARVCDICGEAGWEHMLAVCSKCSDGAEHIYCMWVKMDKVPSGNWMCEECAVQESAEKKMKNIVGRADKCQIESSLKTMSKKDKGLGNTVRAYGLGIRTRKTNKVGKSTIKSRPILVGKRKILSFAKSSELPSSSYKKLIRQHISTKDVDEGKVKHGQVTCTSQVSLNSSSKGANFGFMRSKSFSDGDKNINGSHLLKFGGPKPDVKANGHEKEANGRKLCRSQTFTASSYRSGTDDFRVKRIPTSSHVKGQSIMEDKKVGTLGERKCNPLLASRKDWVHATMGKKRSTMPCQLESPLVSSKCKNGKGRGHRGQNKLLKSTSDLSQRGSNVDDKHHGVIGDVRLHFGNSKEEKSATKGNNLKLPFGFQMPILQANFPSGKLVVPRPDFSWKGEFEVVGTGGASSSFSGFQAFLSNSASLKVLDVVKKFPQKLLLNEVSRLSTWAAWFSGKNAMEQDIALFFLAEDLESYERNYRILSDKMVKEDLALKGCIDGVETLIFLSDILPEGSQRWNGLPYLWCVFRNQTVFYEDNPNSPCNIPEHATRACLPAHPVNGDEYSPGQSSAPTISCVEEQNSNSSSTKTSLHASFMGIPSVSSSKEKLSPAKTVKNQESSVISASMSTEQLFNGSVSDNDFLVDGKDSYRSPIWELKSYSPAARRNHDGVANENLSIGMNIPNSSVEAKHCNGTTSINVSPSSSMFGREVKTTDYGKADHEEWFAPEVLDLQLSLGCGKKSGRGLTLMLGEEMVKDKHCKGKHHDSVTSNDEVSTALVLSLAPRLAR